jgi:hypothetical protein
VKDFGVKHMKVPTKQSSYLTVIGTLTTSITSLIMICETQYRMIEHLAPELLEKTCAKWKRMVSKQWQSLLIYENLWV